MPTNGNHPIQRADAPFDENEKLVSLYFHIPFCEKKCDYCHFFVLPNKENFKEQFMRGLAMEWETRAPLLNGKTIHSIYFGGGTPTLIGPKNIKAILSLIEKADLQISKNTEITLEANPEGTSKEMFSEYAHAGINRLSLGVQSLDDCLLQTLSRKHSAKKAMEATISARDAGIANISIDLMYDIPHQSTAAWKSTLERLVELPITHLSLYNLTFEPHTVFFKKRQNLEPHLPKEDDSRLMYDMASRMLSGIGLEQYEISAFQRPGFYSRHNTGYWLGRPFLGFGPSAFSYWEGERFRNVGNLNQYCRALAEGRTPVDFREVLPKEKQIRELLAIRLRLLEGVDLDSFQRRHGHLDKQLQSELIHLQNKGFVHFTKYSLTLTQQGILFYDTVASEVV